MLLAFVTFTDNQGPYSELCIVSENASVLFPPFRVSLLQPAGAAVYLIGPGEAVIVSQGDEPKSIVFEPLRPAYLYLTPNTPTQPGYAVERIKLIPDSAGYRTFYCPKGELGTTWKEYVANRSRA